MGLVVYQTKAHVNRSEIRGIHEEDPEVDELPRGVVEWSSDARCGTMVFGVERCSASWAINTKEDIGVE
ncbi:unnamed protein product [Nippostrongylus brasiliensis]|uniref:Uncharacterized protein n=1 Tax=Nippostrongylus brasiliensis TaxID=27835 RepID=A0A0N4Y6N8_NIPBR|nr:unnamed protein product [Nippostrongylus brasiliensis]